ncbi:AI-2E family transporter [Staphylococcus massiliensis]|uniref:Permease n=1 Tax=Staphylococcus massiliensis S46 TaxID=1229783 RepID=K9AZX2_9STAP|nr:AI-2E family transporter [Staphylococcus massiliensis]EKU47080.1 permease [Staphylococcus massiliensis S46]MCG3398627.1 AI-2E family transporter [Staphylococcus massiliensis]MCG3401189.1 AI-2E family transporter [Staphylococcus massiliensis]PNZ98516.1 AI-2E family transporter [Staphylococcus massiliensis CCUG 55927]
MSEKETKPSKRIPMRETHFMKFFGGKNLIFALIALILIGIFIFIFDKVSFIFTPLVIIFNTIVGPVLVGLILYYLFNPLVNLMERYHIPRLWGIIILFVFIVAGFGFIVNILIPLISDQLKSLATNVPKLMDKFNQFLDNRFSDGMFASIYNEVQTKATEFSKKIPQMLQKSSGGGGISQTLKSLADTLSNITVIVLTAPFVLFFLLKDGHKFKDYTTKLMPPKYRKDYHDLTEKMSHQVGSYIQGQIIVSLCIGILLFIGYSVIGLKYAVVLACIAAVTSVVPYLGPTIAITPAIIISITMSPIMLLKLVVVWTLVQFIEGHFISPNVMGKTLQIHPLTIIFVLLTAGNLLGVIGVIIGIPAYAVIKVLVTHFFLIFKRRYNKYYSDDAGAYEIEEDRKNVSYE